MGNCCPKCGAYGLQYISHPCVISPVSAAFPKIKPTYEQLEAANADLQRKLYKALAIIKESGGQKPVAEKSLNGLEWEHALTVDLMPAGTKLYTAPVIADRIPEGMVPMPKEIIEFLNGEAELDGCWFGQTNVKHQGKFWLRKFLQAAEQGKK